MALRLQGKRIFVSAAGQGMGRACALALANEGASVVATDINATALESLAAENGSITTRVLDVMSPDDIAAFAAGQQPFDGLFNCAGYVHNGTIEETAESDWDFSFDLNVRSMYRVTKVLLPGLLSQADITGSSVILNMASMASSLKGFRNRLLYGTTKAAVIGFTKAMAADYVGRNLRVNALCPGTVDTPSLRQRISSAPDPVQAEKDFVARQPMGRLATVEDITPMVVYMLSDESRFITGQTMLVDGGVMI